MNVVARLHNVLDSDLVRVDATLRSLVKERSFRRGKFRLSSGAESELYFNLKPTMMSPLGAELSARAFLYRIGNENVDYVGGLEMGAVPVIGSLAAISQVEGRPVKTFFVRKKKKEHGTMDLIEGLGPTETLAGSHVMIVDDVATTGSSILVAITAARAAGAVVNTALVLVNREEGADEVLRDHGVRLLSIFRARDFL